jgi:5-methylcytosine-specific restriction endonuclease McrA
VALLYPCSVCGTLGPRARCLHHPKRGGSSRWRRLVAEVVERDGGVCHLCGLPGATSADHVVPVSRGGRDELANLRAAHLSCNLARRDDDAPPGSPPPAVTGRFTRLA